MNFQKNYLNRRREFRLKQFWGDKAKRGNCHYDRDNCTCCIVTVEDIEGELKKLPMSLEFYKKKIKRCPKYIL